MFSSVSFCTPSTLISTQYRAESNHVLDIDSNVTITVNGVVRYERPIIIIKADLIKAQVLSPSTFLGHEFYTYTIDTMPQCFAVVCRNNYQPTVKEKDNKLKWYNYLNLSPKITYYDGGKQYSSTYLVGWGGDYIDIEDLHVILSPLTNSLNFYSIDHRMVSRVNMPAGPIDYKKSVSTTPIGTYTHELYVLCSDYKVYRVIFDRRIYASDEFRPSIRPFFNLDDLPFQQDMPTGGSFLDAARKRFLSSLFPVVVALDINSNEIWIAGSDKVYILNRNFIILRTVTLPGEEIVTITCFYSGAVVTTRSQKLIYVGTTGTIQLYQSTSLGTPAATNNGLKLFVPDSNNQRLCVFEDLSGAYTVWSTPEFCPAYARVFNNRLFVTGHDNINVLEYVVDDVYKVISFQEKVTLVSVVKQSMIGIHYLIDYTVLDLTGIKKIIPINFETRRGGITHIGTEPKLVTMLGEPGVTPFAGPGLTVWSNGIAGEPLINQDYIGVSYRAELNGTFRAPVVVGDLAIDYTVIAESSQTIEDNYAATRQQVNKLTLPYTSNIIPTTGNIDYGTTSLSLPFTLHVYGQTFNSLNVTTKGYITFGNNYLVQSLPVTGNVSAAAIYVEPGNLYQGLPINNVDPNNITTGVLSSGEIPGVYWQDQTFDDYVGIRLKWIGTDYRYYPLGNTVAVSATVYNTNKLPTGLNVNYNINDYVSGNVVTVSTRVVGRSSYSNTAKIYQTDSVTNRYYLRTLRTVEPYTEIYHNGNYKGYVEQIGFSSELGPRILSKTGGYTLLVDTPVAHKFTVETAVMCETAFLAIVQFLVKPTSSANVYYGFNPTRNNNSTWIYVNSSVIPQIINQSTLYGNTVIGSPRITGTGLITRSFTVTPILNAGSISFNISSNNAEKPWTVDYNIQGLSSPNAQPFFNNVSLQGTISTYSDFQSITFSTDSNVEIYNDNFTAIFTSNIVENQPVILTVPGTITDNVTVVIGPTVTNSFVEHYVIASTTINSTVSTNYWTWHTMVNFDPAANPDPDIYLIDGRESVTFVKNWVQVANATVDLAIHERPLFTGNFALLDNTVSAQIGNLFLFKSNIAAPTVSYEVGLYSGALFQYLELFYPASSFHQTSTVVGVRADSTKSNSNVTITNTTANVSYVFASPVLTGNWRYLGPGSFVENYSGYIGRYPRIYYAETTQDNELRYELDIDNTIPAGSNVYLALDYGFLQHNGKSYTGFGSNTTIKPGDFVGVTVPFNRSRRPVAPVLSFGDMQVALPSVPDSVFASYIQTTYLHDNQPTDTLVSGNVIIVYTGDYVIPDYYRGAADYRKNISFKRTRSGVTTTLSGRYHTLVNGDIITAEKIKTSRRKYDIRDVVVVGPETLRLAYRTNTDPIFNRLDYDQLVEPMTRTQDYYYDGVNEYQQGITKYRTTNITLTSNSGTVSSRLYIDYPSTEFVINGNVQNSYVTSISTGSNVAIQRTINSYFESNVIIYQLHVDIDQGNIFIPIGHWPVRNKVIAVQPDKEQSQYVSVSVSQSHLVPQIYRTIDYLTSDFFIGATVMVGNVESNFQKQSEFNYYSILEELVKSTTLMNFAIDQAEYVQYTEVSLAAPINELIPQATQSEQPPIDSEHFNYTIIYQNIKDSEWISYDIAFTSDPVIGELNGRTEIYADLRQAQWVDYDISFSAAAANGELFSHTELYVEKHDAQWLENNVSILIPTPIGKLFDYTEVMTPAYIGIILPNMSWLPGSTGEAINSAYQTLISNNLYQSQVETKISILYIKQLTNELIDRTILYYRINDVEVFDPYSILYFDQLTQDMHYDSLIYIDDVDAQHLMSIDPVYFDYNSSGFYPKTEVSMPEYTMELIGKNYHWTPPSFKEEVNFSISNVDYEEYKIANAVINYVKYSAQAYGTPLYNYYEWFSNVEPVFTESYSGHQTKVDTLDDSLVPPNFQTEIATVPWDLDENTFKRQLPSQYNYVDYDTENLPGPNIMNTGGDFQVQLPTRYNYYDSPSDVIPGPDFYLIDGNVKVISKSVYYYDPDKLVLEAGTDIYYDGAFNTIEYDILFHDPDSIYYDLGLGFNYDPPSIAETYDVKFHYAAPVTGLLPNELAIDLNFRPSQSSNYTYKMTFQHYKKQDIGYDLLFNKLSDTEPLDFSIELLHISDTGTAFSNEYMVDDKREAFTLNINPMYIENIPTELIKIAPFMYNRPDEIIFDHQFHLDRAEELIRELLAERINQSRSIVLELDVEYFSESQSIILDLDGEFLPESRSIVMFLDPQVQSQSRSVVLNLDSALQEQYGLRFYADPEFVQRDQFSDSIDPLWVQSQDQQFSLLKEFFSQNLVTRDLMPLFLKPEPKTISIGSEFYRNSPIIRKIEALYDIKPYRAVEIKPKLDKEPTYSYAERDTYGTFQSNVYFFASNKIWSRYEPDITMSGVAQEGDTLYLNAPSGYIFKSVEFASYGLPEGRPGTYIINPEAHAPNSLDIVQGIICGRAGNVAIKATDILFGNPVVGIRKKLIVTATAVPQNRYKIQEYPSISSSGIISAYGQEIIHYYTTSGTFVASKDAELEVVALGGGGGGGAGDFQRGAGGGGGGIAVGRFKITAGQTLDVFVGGGGQGGMFGASGAGGAGGANGGGAGGSAGPSGQSGGGGGGGGWSGVRLNGTYMVVGGGGAGGGGAAEGTANELPASGGGNQIGGQNTGTMNGGAGSAFAGIGIVGYGTRIFSIKDGGLGGPPNFESVQPNYGEFLIEHGVWNIEPGETDFARTYTVNFPTTTYYLFAGSVDDSGNVFLDGTRVLQIIDYATPNTNTVMVTAGNHTVSIIGRNDAGVGSIAVTIEIATIDGGGGGGGGGGFVGGAGQTGINKGGRASGGQNYVANSAQTMALLEGFDGDQVRGGPPPMFATTGYHDGNRLYEGYSYPGLGLEVPSTANSISGLVDATSLSWGTFLNSYGVTNSALQSITGTTVVVRTFVAGNSGTYKFEYAADDAIRIKVNGNILVNSAAYSGAGSNVVTTYLPSGVHILEFTVTNNPSIITASHGGWGGFLNTYGITTPAIAYASGTALIKLSATFPYTGNYKFTYSSDDGLVWTIPGIKSIASNPNYTGSTSVEVTHSMPAGTYEMHFSLTNYPGPSGVAATISNNGGTIIWDTRSAANGLVSGDSAGFAVIIRDVSNKIVWDTRTAKPDTYVNPGLGTLLAGSAYGGGQGGAGGEIVAAGSDPSGKDGRRGLVIIKYVKPKVYSPFVFYEQHYNYAMGGFSSYEKAADEARKFVSATPFMIPGTNYWNHRVFFNTHIYAVPAKPDAYFYEKHLPGLYANAAVISRPGAVRILVQGSELPNGEIVPYTVTTNSNPIGLPLLHANVAINGNLVLRNNRAIFDIRVINNGGTSPNTVTFRTLGPGCLANLTVNVTVQAVGVAGVAGNLKLSNCDVLTANLMLPTTYGRPVELPQFFSRESNIKIKDNHVDNSNRYVKYPGYIKDNGNAPVAPGSNVHEEVEDYFYRSSNIKVDSWTLGSGSVPGYNANQTSATENFRKRDIDPWNRLSTVWETRASGDGNNDGGWNGDYFPINPDATYRSVVWIRRTSATAGGTIYHGLHTNGTEPAYPNSYSAVGNVRRLTDGKGEWNPYWNYKPATDYWLNVWYLHVGYIFPRNHTGNLEHPESGIYTRSAGKVMLNSGNITDGKFPQNATQAMQRVYHFYCPDNTTTIQFCYPRFEEVNRYTPTVEMLLEYGPYEIPQFRNQAPTKYVVARRKTWPITWLNRGG